MATKPQHFCNHAGCATLTGNHYCDTHTPLHDTGRTDYRDAASERGYDSKWRKVRDRYLSAHPLCERCEQQGRVEIAEVVHHINPINAGGPRLDPRNLRALCRDCHEFTHGRKREA